MKTSIVIESSSRKIRVGFATEQQPRFVFPALVNGNNVGENASGGSYPMDEFGIVTDWDGMKKLWSHAFNLLGVNPSEHFVLLTEAPMNPKNYREKLTQIMFDTFKVGGMYLAVNSTLAAYARGVYTALIVQMEEESVYAVPLFDGYVLTHAALRFSKGVEDSYVPELIYDAIMKSDVDVRKELIPKIILAGDVTYASGLASHLEKEIQKLLPQTYCRFAKVVEPADRSILTWKGGCVLASNPNFGQSWISPAEYSASGATIVHRKCF